MPVWHVPCSIKKKKWSYKVVYYPWRVMWVVPVSWVVILQPSLCHYMPALAESGACKDEAGAITLHLWLPTWLLRGSALLHFSFYTSIWEAVGLFCMPLMWFFSQKLQVLIVCTFLYVSSNIHSSYCIFLRMLVQGAFKACQQWDLLDKSQMLGRRFV